MHKCAINPITNPNPVYGYTYHVTVVKRDFSFREIACTTYEVEWTHFIKFASFQNGVLEDEDLKEMGIDSERDREAIMESARSLPCKVHEQQNTALNNNNNPASSERGDADEEEAPVTATDSVETEETAVDQWLNSIRLGVYKETFRKHLYTDMDRVRRIWEVELTAVLEIHRVGHRKRILTSVSGHQSHGSHGPNLEDINADLNLLVSY